ncbi:MAG: M16 family metallopeptidase, partial [Candidatus Eremiobacterales bacterium]
MNVSSLVAFPLLALTFAATGTPAMAAAQETSGASAQAVTVTRTTLPNGLRVVVLRDTLAPVVTAVMNYEVGADDEPIYGIAHATEHMMFRGSKSLDASQLAEVTAVTGGDFDADTQNEITQYFYTMPSQYLDIALHLEASRARGLLLEQKLWNQERGAIEQEVVQDNSQALYRLGIKVQAHLLAGTPYADDGLGSLESFGRRIEAPQLRAFYAAWYHPNNAVYVIAGHVDPQTTIAQVARVFGAIPAAALPARKPVALRPLVPATYTDVSDQAYTVVSLNYRFPGYDDPDFAAGQVLADVLNSERSDLYG